jgi:hypothetical protein
VPLKPTCLKQENPARIKDDATLEELRADVMKHLTRLTKAGILDLQALPVPNSE